MELLSEAVAKAPALLFGSSFEALGLEWDADTRELVYKVNPKTGKRERGATHVGFSREGVARKSGHKDYALQDRIANNLVDRVFGKPRISMELGAQMGVGIVAIPQDHDRATEVANILHEVGALPDPVEPLAETEEPVESAKPKKTAKSRSKSPKSRSKSSKSRSKTGK